ncbi:Adenylate cyclase type 10 [Phlyctochytrium planicorne]|nr:Adenylate cyclase type 10 [Phlyctochytrium planicorne]
MKSFGTIVYDVSSELLEDVIAKSQGNPMVIKLLCNFLSTSTDVTVKNQVLCHVFGRTQTDKKFALPMNVSAAVISSVDKLTPKAQMILRIASVAGQFFTLDELVYSLTELKIEITDSGAEIKTAIVKLLNMAQTHGILSTSAATDSGPKDFSFHHYLIYQGIYESILQSRRIEIHQTYANYFEMLYISDNSKLHLPALLHHLLKVPGLNEKKAQFCRIAFGIFAEENRPIEAMKFYDIYKDLEKTENTVSTVMQKVLEKRLLSQTYLQLRDYEGSKNLCFKALSDIGCEIYTDGLKRINLILKILWCASKVKRMTKNSYEDRRALAFLALSSLAKKAFSSEEIWDFVNVLLTTKSQGHHQNKKKAFRQTLETVSEISMLCAFTVGLMMKFLNPGAEIALLHFLYYLSQVVVANDDNRLAGADIACGVIFIELRSPQLSSKLFDEATMLIRNPRDIEMTRSGLSALWCIGLLSFARGDYPNAIVSFSIHTDIVTKVFAASIAETQFVRTLLIVAHSLMGNFHQLVDDTSRDLTTKCKELTESAEVADLQMCLAYHYISMGRTNEAFELSKTYGVIADEITSPWHIPAA